jgi:hypothetical protein
MYVDEMSKLEASHPEVYRHFMNGLHVVRRSDRFLGGFSSDLIIEQVLMRSVKSTGGLTRGHGMTEQQRNIWLLSMPACADISSSMQEFTAVSYETSEQHKEETKSRIERDWKDSKAMMGFLDERNPFEVNADVLQNIANGVTSDKTVNAENAKCIGIRILNDMCGTKVNEYTFKRKQQVVQMSTKPSVKVEGDHIQIDPQLLFQRLITIGQGEVPVDELETLFSYELCTHAPALFDSSGQLREAKKSVIADALWEYVKLDIPNLPDDVHHP